MQLRGKSNTLEEREEHGKQSLSSGDLIGFNGSRPQIEGFTNGFTIGWSRKSFDSDCVHSFPSLTANVGYWNIQWKNWTHLRHLVHPETSTRRKPAIAASGICRCRPRYFPLHRLVWPCLLSDSRVADGRKFWSDSL